MKNIAFFLAVLVLWAAARDATAGMWVTETVFNGTQSVESTIIALDSNDSPNIVSPNPDLEPTLFADPITSFRLYIKIGSSWSAQRVRDRWGPAPLISFALNKNNNGRYYVGPIQDFNRTDYRQLMMNYNGTDKLYAVSIGRVNFPSIAIDSINRYHIAYSDYGTGKYNLYYISGEVTSNTWTREAVDTVGDVGRWTSIAIDSNNLPHISYYDKTNLRLKYAYKNSTGVWIKEVVDSGNVGETTSIKLDKQNRPHIAYYDTGNLNLKYAYKSGGVWNKFTIDSAGSVGFYSSLALDSNDRPHISYRDATNLKLKYARYISAEGWTATAGSGLVNVPGSGWWDIGTVDSSLGAGGFYCSLALDAENRPHISYLTEDRKGVRYATLAR